MKEVFMDTKPPILLYGKTMKTTKTKMSPIYKRVTINEEIYGVSTMRYVEPAKWVAGAGE